MDRGPSQGSLPRHVSAPHSHRLRASALHGPLASRAAPHNCQTCAPVMIFSATTPGFGHQLDIAFKIVPHALFVYLRNSIQLSIISRQFVGFRNPPDPILCVVRSPLPLLSGSGHNRFLQLSASLLFFLPGGFQVACVNYVDFEVHQIPFCVLSAVSLVAVYHHCAHSVVSPPPTAYGVLSLSSLILDRIDSYNSHSTYATVHLCFPLNACLQHNTLLPRLLSHTIFVFVGFSFTSSP